MFENHNLVVSQFFLFPSLNFHIFLISKSIIHSQIPGVCEVFGLSTKNKNYVDFSHCIKFYLVVVGRSFNMSNFGGIADFK